MMGACGRTIADRCSGLEHMGALVLWVVGWKQSRLQLLGGGHYNYAVVGLWGTEVMEVSCRLLSWSGDEATEALSLGRKGPAHGKRG